MDKSKLLEPVDNGWFHEDPEKYLSRDDFKALEQISKVNIRDLYSEDTALRGAAQEKLASQTTLLNEIRASHGGFKMPLLYYTHNFRFGSPLPNQNMELEKLIYSMDMGDSLRRRHIALSHSIIPDTIRARSAELSRPLSLANLGSGIGLDGINAVMHTNGLVRKVQNYDLDQEALVLGRQITNYLEGTKQIDKGVFDFIPRTMTELSDKSDITLMVGVICPLRDVVALSLMKVAYKALNPEGTLIVSSSNDKMLSDDPVSSFLIQNLGSRDNPHEGWGLNCRPKERLFGLLDRVGFKDIKIYDDSNYPGKENIAPEILDGIDTLPSKALNLRYSDHPFSLPSPKTLAEAKGYNWIAVARK